MPALVQLSDEGGDMNVARRVYCLPKIVHRGDYGRHEFERESSLQLHTIGKIREVPDGIIVSLNYIWAYLCYFQDYDMTP